MPERTAKEQAKIDKDKEKRRKQDEKEDKKRRAQLEKDKLLEERKKAKMEQMQNRSKKIAEKEKIAEEKQKKFFIFFSLQAGSCISGTVGVAMMITVLIFHSTSENRYTEDRYTQFYQRLNIYGYTSVMLFGFILITFSSFMATTVILMFGIVIIFFGFLGWIGMWVCGYIPNDQLFEFVCVDNRCPETHWLINSRWRDYGYKCPYETSYRGEDPTYYDIETTQAPQSESESPESSVKEEYMKSKYVGCEKYSIPLIAMSTGIGSAWFLFLLYAVRTFCCFLFELQNFPDDEV